MNEVKRYACCGDWGYEADPNEDKKGGCVKFEDYESLRSRITKLERVVAAARELVCVDETEEEWIKLSEALKDLDEGK